jgi:hypothetical protein
VIAVGERFAVVVRTEDRYGNRSASGSPGWELRADDRVVATLEPGDDAVAIAKGVRFDQPGTYRVTARSTDGELVATSNPVWVMTNPDRRVYWGELHGHSGYAEGQGAADQYFRYARDDARLDFVSLTDHDTAMDDGEWKAIDDARRRFDENGEFVTFLGYEWSAGRELGGHRAFPGKRRPRSTTSTEVLAPTSLGRAPQATGRVIAVARSATRTCW